MSSRIRKAKYNNIKRLNEGILNETDLCNCNHHGMDECNTTYSFHCSAGCCSDSVTDCASGNSYSHDSGGHGGPGDEACRPVSPTADWDFDQSFYDEWEGDYGHHVGHGVNKDKNFISSKKKLKKLKEGCGCGEAKETSEDSYMAASQLHSIANKAEDMYNKLEKDEVLEDWIESHLAKIDQMMDSVSDSFAHDESKDAGDIGAGGCPPGQHWCAESGMCRNDNPPQMEPLTLMGADVMALQERISKKIKK